MSKKTFLIVSITFITIFLIGFGYIKIDDKLSDSRQTDDIKILTELPPEIERTNPVPEVRIWNSNDRTFYYFNWGLQPTSGYNLSLLAVKNKKLIIQASLPDPDNINAQVLTYPYLLVSLPKGEYRFEVVDERNRPIKDIFRPKNRPLSLTVFVPSGPQGILERKVLRDPYLNNEGKETIQIALEALFAQDEMMDYLNHALFFEGVSLSASLNKCSVSLSRGYRSLAKPEQELVKQLITKTVKAVGTANIDNVEITADP